MSNENKNQTANTGELDEQELDTVAGGQAVMVIVKPKPSLGESVVHAVGTAIQHTWAAIAPNAGSSDGTSSGNGTTGVRG